MDPVPQPCHALNMFKTRTGAALPRRASVGAELRAFGRWVARGAAVVLVLGTVVGLIGRGHRRPVPLPAELGGGTEWIEPAWATLPMGLATWSVPVLLWGLCATVLRYIPYIGPWIAAVLPVSVSLITSPGWTQLFLVLALFLVLELVSNNVMEPWLYGSSTGLSTMAILVAAVFWTWLWGPIGLFMSTPLTVCIVVLGKHVTQLKFPGPDAATKA